MLDTLTDANSRDFNARYAGTFGWLLTNGEKRLVHVTDVTDREVFFRTTHKGMDHHVVRNSGVMFEFTQIERGFYHGSDGVIYHMSRIPARQWRRGICRANTSLLSLNKGNWREEAMTVDKLHVVLSNTSNNYTEDSDKAEVVLSRFFAISGGSVFFNRHVIGTTDPKTNVISLTAAGVFVQQELTDAINRTGWNKCLTLKI